MTITLADAVSIAPPNPPPRILAEDEIRLVAEMRSGRREAAELLAESSYPQLWRLACRLTGSPDRAADLVQETYRKAWQALPEFRGDSRFSTWLFRIAFTTHLKQHRRPRLVEPLTHAHEESVADLGPGPESTAEQRERDRRLRAAVAELPEELRFAVVAHYWGDAPVREIAAAEQMTPMGVRKRLARAFRILSAALEETSR